MDPKWYRTRLFLDAVRLLLFPAAVLAIFLHLVRLRLGGISLLCYPIFVLVWTLAKGFYYDCAQTLEAGQLGAQLIPRVVGRWPGNVDVLLRILRSTKSGHLYDAYLELFNEYKATTLNLRIFWIDHLITMDQEHIKFILSTGFEKFWRGRGQKERMETFLGAGIFNRDDEQWKLHRSIARPFFARERISDFEVFEKHASKTLLLLSRFSSSDSPCDVQDLYSRFTLDAASEFLFGTNLNTLQASLPVAGKTAMGPKGSTTHDSWGSFAVAFEMAQQITSRRARLGYFWPVFELFRDRSIPHAKAIQRWLDPILNQTLAEKAKLGQVGLNRPVEEKNFLQYLAENTENPTLIRDQLLNMLLASRDTTACLLTFVTYLLALTPSVMQRLREEILAQCGSRNAPTYECIRQMKYLRAVLNETLRIFPPVPLNMRECRPISCVLPSPDPTFVSELPHPFYVPGATGVTFFPLLMQRSPALWGKDADIFDPERWLQPDRLANFTTNPSMFLPFGAGPRMCLGQNYAYNEASYFLVRLLQRFDHVELAPEAQPVGSLPPADWKLRGGRPSVERIWPSAAITLYVKGGMWVRFRSRNGA